MNSFMFQSTHTGHFGDESFQAITCAVTDITKQTTENTPKTQNKQTGPR